VYLPAFLVLVYFSIIVLSKPIDQLNTYSYSFDNKKSIPLMIVTAFFTVFISITAYRWVLAEYHYLNISAFSGINENKLEVKAGLKSLEYNNFPPNTYTRIAMGLIKLDHAETAILYLKKAIDISPFNTKALLVLAKIYQSGASVDDLKQERKILEFILSFDPKNVEALSYLVRSLAEEGRSKDATIVYKRMKNNIEYFKGRRNFGTYHKFVGYVAIAVGDNQYAQYIYQDAIKDYPTAENYINLGMVEFDLLKNKDKGIEMYKKALLIDPNVNVAEEIKKTIDKYESSVEQ
jgi:tetratricopeptide (TPR) repeat protein